jgi:threonine aldolase
MLEAMMSATDSPTVDLRSDTVTQPTPAMRQAMAQAEVGDDVFGDDPTVNRLQSMAAELLVKEAALFVPSGTMGNLSAVLTHCARGDEVILGDQSHTATTEAGGVAALGGVHPRTIPNQPDGTLSLAAIEAAINPDDDHYPISRLICLENTHNRCGGVALTAEYTRQVGELARARGLRLHLDGARLFNAAAATGSAAAELAAPADSVTFCLSKALCAPVGSIVCGEAEFIRRVRRARKQLGGGMRQAGVLAAAGIVALETMTERLVEDHVRARALAEQLAEIPGIVLEANPPPTNMIYLGLAPELPLDGAGMEQALAGDKILIHAVGPRRIRLVLHYWIDDEGVDRAVAAFRRALAAGRK